MKYLIKKQSFLSERKFNKTHEKFKEIYNVDPNKDVIINDQYINGEDINGKGLKKFKGKLAKMEYNKNDFFATVYFEGETLYNFPVYKLINKETYLIKRIVRPILKQKNIICETNID